MYIENKNIFFRYYKIITFFVLLFKPLIVSLSFMCVWRFHAALFFKLVLSLLTSYVRFVALRTCSHDRSPVYFVLFVSWMCVIFFLTYMFSCRRDKLDMMPQLNFYYRFSTFSFIYYRRVSVIDVVFFVCLFVEHLAGFAQWAMLIDTYVRPCCMVLNWTTRRSLNSSSFSYLLIFNVLFWFVMFFF